MFYSGIRRKKYGATRVQADGRSFASKLEFALYEQLRLQSLAGELKDIQCQDHVYLTEARVLYMPDFKYFDLRSNQWEWAEAKGIETDVWRIKRRLWGHYGPGILHVWKGNRAGLFLDESIRSKASLPSETG